MEGMYGNSSARNAVFAESATQLRLDAAANQVDAAAGQIVQQPVAQVRSLAHAYYFMLHLKALCRVLLLLNVFQVVRH